jgi:hypothetical protein
VHEGSWGQGFSICMYNLIQDVAVSARERI